MAHSDVPNEAIDLPLVADQFQCFCIELNRSATVFCKLDGSTRQLLKERNNVILR